ncbi:MAG: pyridoxal phosphate-dependent aminotransferase [Vulcanimicrobiaceae bacterium]
MISALINPRVLEIPGSLIREIAGKKRPSSLDLGLGEPTLMPTSTHLQAAMRDAEADGLRYTPNAGDPELRRAIATHYAYPGMAGEDAVCVTTGSQEAMYVAIKTLLDPARDELLVVEPAFPSYAKMARLEGVLVRGVAMDERDDFAFDPERILSAIGPRTKAVVICSPCNPTARVLSQDAADALVVALQRRDGDPVWLIHDEIYREQTYVDDAASLARLYPYTLVTNSVSKSNALTGLRLGWLLAPAPVTKAAIKAHAWITSCADTFAQRVALSIFRTPGALQEHASWYAAARTDVVDALNKSGLRFIAPEGSFYACVRLPEGVASLPAAHALAADEDVIAVPGIAFGPSFEGWLRLSWVGPMPRVIEGIERIAKWCRAAG